MNNLKDLFHEVVDDFYLLTHVGFSQFELDADELENAISSDLLKDDEQSDVKFR